MMISPDGRALFVEVPKTGSTAASAFLRKNGWWQNGSQGARRVPGTVTGRHTTLTAESGQWMDEHEVVAYGVVRNPWDRMASLWRASAPGTQSFWDYMTTGRFNTGDYDLIHMQQADWLEHVDYVMRYETLIGDWTMRAAALGHLPPIPEHGFDVVNRSKRQAKPEWTQREIDLISERFELDIAVWGYTGPS